VSSGEARIDNAGPLRERTCCGALKSLEKRDRLLEDLWSSVQLFVIRHHNCEWQHLATLSRSAGKRFETACGKVRYFKR
jgi:ribosomal 50S subunit-associated protein YjgA (DUF615 family)